MQDTLFSAAGSQVDVDSRKHGLEVNPKEMQGKEYKKVLKKKPAYRKY